MLSRLIGFSLRQSSLVIALAGLLVVFAGLKLREMPVDVFPELNAPTVVIMSEAAGFAADEVESNVTFPIETAVNGLAGARRVRSSSATSLSIVWVEFDWGTDIYRARQLVSERLSAVRETLPENVHAEITPVTSITGEVMLLALSSPDGKATPLAVREYAEFTLRNRLLAVPGVAQVVAIGGELPQYQVEVRQERLARHGITIEEVVEAARSAHSTATAGYLANVDNQELPIRQMARVRGVDDISRTLVRMDEGTPITIGDVADVRVGPSPKRGTAADRGVPAVVVSVQKSPGTNTLELTKELDRALDGLEKAMPAGITLNRDPFRAARFIDRALDNVVRVLVEASIIVAIILVLFLLDVRATIVTLTALPLSLAVALLVLWAWGLSVNVMTLGGLAVAIGELVDDAIIDVENVLRRLRINAALPAGERRGVTEVVYDASNEIRSSVVFATVIICMVFVPLLFLKGLEGRFFQPLGIAYIVSILASLVVALSVTPALCKVLFAKSFRDGAPSHHGESALVRWLKRRYEPLLRAALERRRTVVAGALGLAVAALAYAWSFGTSFLPTFQEGTFTTFLMAPPGTSLAESDRLARGVEQRLIGIEGVSSVTRRTGRAERDEHAEPVSFSEIEVTMKAGASPAAVRAEIDRIIADVPGINTMIGQPIEHRLSHILSGTPAAVAIDIFGNDLDVLRGVAKEVEAALKSVPGTRDVNANREVLVTSLPIRYRSQDLAAAGLTPASAARQVQQALHGESVAEVNQGVQRLEIVVRLAEEDRARIEQVGELILRGEGGALVRLREVADIGPERTSNLIARENAQRKAIVSTNIADGYNLGDLVAAVRAKVDPIVARAGCTVRYGGQFEAQQSASRTILSMGAIVAVLMFVMLQAATGRARTAALVMLNLPLALIGGIAAIALTAPSGTTPILSIPSMIGFITLFGIAVRNGILLVNHFAHLEQHEGCTPAQSLVRGSLERLVPILMTALTAALGLIPLALSGSKPGSEILAPLAIVVLGGLVSSTVLNLFVVPAGYALAFRIKQSH
jgi:CzcA family heavy metal efflux pump